jgi:uncharacterized protein with HEPN domain
VPRRDWWLRIADILAAIERIRRYTDRMDEGAFVQDQRTAEAVCFALVAIGEAASHVPAAVHPGQRHRGHARRRRHRRARGVQAGRAMTVGCNHR